MIFSGRTDLALARDPSGRLVPWIIAVMVFVGSVALAGALGLDRAAQAWRHVVSDNLTVQVADGPDADRQAEAAARLLRDTPGIFAVRVLSRAEIVKLLEPWLGTAAEQTALPVPRLIDVKLQSGYGVDPGALSARLKESVPSARLDDHAPWLERLARVTRGLEILAFTTVGLIAFATMAIVVFAIRAGLLVHRDVIELLHLIGAHDSYIAAQFQQHAVRLATKGAIPALLLAVSLAIGLGVAAEALRAPLMPKIALGPEGWLGLLAAPIIVIVLAAVTARVTVLLNLKRML